VIRPGKKGNAIAILLFAGAGFAMAAVLSGFAFEAARAASLNRLLFGLMSVICTAACVRMCVLLMRALKENTLGGDAE